MAEITIAGVRAKFPQYQSLSDGDLANALHAKFYPQLDRADFYSRIGYDPTATSPRPKPRPQAGATGFADQMAQLAFPTPPGQVAPTPAPQAMLPQAAPAALSAPNLPDQAPAPMLPQIQPPDVVNAILDAGGVAGLRDRVAAGQGVMPFTPGMALPQIPAAPNAQQAPDPFRGEGFSSLSKRRGQQFIAALTDTVATLPEDLSIAASNLENSVKDSAPQNVIDNIRSATKFKKTLQSGISPLSGRKLTPNETANLHRKLNEDIVGIKTWMDQSNFSVTPADQRQGFKFGAKIRNKSNEIFGKPDPRDVGFWSQMAQGAGSMVGFAAAGALGGAIGGPAGAMIAGGVSGAGLNEAQVYKEAKAAGASEKAALKAARWAIPVGATEILPILHAFKILPKSIREKVTNKVLQKMLPVAGGGLEEFTQEGGQQIANNLIASGLYDPKRGWKDGVTENAIIGALLGGVVGGVGVAYDSAKNKTSSSDVAAMSGPKIKGGLSVEIRKPPVKNTAPESAAPSPTPTAPSLAIAPPSEASGVVKTPASDTAPNKTPPAQPTAPQPEAPAAGPVVPEAPKPEAKLATGAKAKAPFEAKAWTELPGVSGGKETGRTFMENQKTGEVIPKAEFDARVAKQVDTSAPTPAPAPEAAPVKPVAPDVAPVKPKAEPVAPSVEGDPVAAAKLGSQAYKAGDKRALPSQIDPTDAVAANAWYKGWDKANIDAPIPSAKPVVNPATSEAQNTPKDVVPAPPTQGTAVLSQKEANATLPDGVRAVRRNAMDAKTWTLLGNGGKPIGSFKSTATDGIDTATFGRMKNMVKGRSKSGASADAAFKAAQDNGKLQVIHVTGKSRQQPKLTLKDATDRWNSMTTAQRVELAGQANPSSDPALRARFAKKWWEEITASTQKRILQTMQKVQDGKAHAPQSVASDASASAGPIGAATDKVQSQSAPATSAPSGEGSIANSGGGKETSPHDAPTLLAERVKALREGKVTPTKLTGANAEPQSNRSKAEEALPDGYTLTQIKKTTKGFFAAVERNDNGKREGGHGTTPGGAAQSAVHLLYAKYGEVKAGDTTASDLSPQEANIAHKIAKLAGGIEKYSIRNIKEAAATRGFGNLVFIFNVKNGKGGFTRLWVNGDGKTISTAIKSTPKSVLDGTYYDVLSSHITVPLGFSPESIFGNQTAEPATADQPTVKLGNRLAEMIMSGEGVPKTNIDLMKLAAEEFGGTISEGAFSPKDAYEALELAANLAIEEAQFEPIGNPEYAKKIVGHLQDMIDQFPTQTRRDIETDQFQQFSTPPTYGYAVNWIANVRSGDHVLEPSAGNGGIAVFAKNAGAKVDVNELAPRRVPSLEALGFDRVTTENAEQIGNIWANDPTRSYDIVVMNPPFSASAGRITKKTSATGAQHIEQALDLLKPGGRIVAIMGHTFQRGNSRLTPFFKSLEGNATIVANVVVKGDQVYKKYGTTHDNRLLVIDKVAPAEGSVTFTGEASTIPELIDMMEGIRNAHEPRTATRADASNGKLAVGNESGKPVENGGGAGDGKPVSVSKSNDMGGEASKSGGHGKSDIADGRGTGAATDSKVSDGKGKPTADNGKRGATGSSGPTSNDGRKPTVRITTADETKVDDAGGGLSTYQPTVRVEGAKEHPMLLVESSAMASVKLPKPNHDMQLPKKMITEGLLSEAQLQMVLYAGAAHAEMLPAEPNGVPFRKGFYTGDSTGVGKTREIAGVIADNWAHGRKKHILISKDKKLLKGARRDFDNVGMKNVPIADLGKVKADGVIPKDTNGVMFATYSTIGRSPKPEQKSRIEQIIEWAGPNFDGTITFDEAHLAGNALSVKGKRGTTKPSATALAVIDLQNALPNARVVYASATAATEVANLAYATRLGLWGTGTPFPTVESFVTQIDKGGIAAMEVVARDMKQLGVYMARSLSFDGVEYVKVEHTLTEDQRGMYDAAAQGWQGVLSNVMEVVNDHTKGGGRQRGAALAQFWGAHQRFFNQVLTAMQMPTILKNIESDLKAGMSPVIQIVNTNEAATKKALAKMEQGDTLEDIDITPREDLMQYLETSFPVHQYEEYTDDNGNVRTRPAQDSKGNFIINNKAVKIRDELVGKLGAMTLPGNPLDMIIEKFGADNVAEVTGRSQRIVTSDGKKVKERRSQSKTMAEAQEFQAGKRKVLIFSDAGGTGMDFHADKGAKNQKRRAHYILQAGWRADRAIQGFGRTHRTNQVSPPIYKLAGTNLSGHKRFTSSIARRLDQLGALTKGQKEASGSGMFNATDNLENEFAQAAVTSLFYDIYRGDIKDFTPAEAEKELGLNIVGEKGFNVSKIPPVPQFLNRLLNVTIDRQNMLFDKFITHMENAVQVAIDNNEYTAGVELVKHDGAVLLDTKEAYRDTATGATSEYRMVKLTKKVEVTPFVTIDTQWTNIRYKKNRDTGLVYAFRPASSRTNENGQVIPTYHRYSPTDRRIIDSQDYQFRYDMVKADAAEIAWGKQIKEAPATREETLHLVTGALLPIWDRLPSKSPKIVRLNLDDGRSLLGREIPDIELTRTLENLGVTGPEIDMSAPEIQASVLGGKTILLSSGHRITRRRVGGEQRIEVIPSPNDAYSDTMPGGTLQRLGFQIERINYKARVFAATGEKGIPAIEAFMNGKSIVNVTMERQQSAWHGSPQDFGQFSTAHMGTGEGAQAFGWGLYFAGRKEIAKYYRDKLSNQASMITVGNDKFKVRTRNFGSATAVERATSMVSNMLNDHPDANNMALDFAIRRTKADIRSAEIGNLTAFKKDAGWGNVSLLTDTLSVLESWRGKKIEKATGKIYKVEIPENENLLAWDRDMAGQTKAVKNKLKSSGILKEFRDNKSDFSSPQNTRGKLKGENLYNFIEWKKGSDRAASKLLNDIGISGHRFLDQASRDNGKGTYNYVIYDDAVIKILEKEQRVDQGPIAPYRDLMPQSRVFKQFSAELKKLGLGNVTLQFDPFFAHQGMAYADHFGKMVITIGNTLNPRWTMGHESVHIYKHMGVFTKPEWALLSDTAKSDWIKRYDIASRYRDLPLDQQVEEAVAEAFGEAYSKSKDFVVEPRIKAVMRKIANFLRAIRNWARGLGMKTSSDIIEAMTRGEFSDRAGTFNKAAKQTNNLASKVDWASQTDRLMKQQRRASDIERTGGNLYIPDRQVWDTLLHYNGDILSRLKETKGAINDRRDLALTRIQSTMLPFRRAQEIIEREMGAPIPEDLNAVVAAKLYPGRTGYKLESISDNFITPIIDIIGRTKGMTSETVGDYLYARHAAERNKHIAKINPDMPEDGSWMSDASATAILDGINASPAASSYEEIGALIDRLREQTIQERVDMGLMTETEAEVLRNSYEYYVPLKGWDETDNADATLDVSGIGRGYNVRGNETRRAFGRTTKAFNPLIAAFTQAQEVVVRGEKNRVGQRMYKLAKDIPSPDLWEIKKVETKRVFNEATGLVEKRSVSPISLIMAANEIAVKVDGEEHRIIFHDQRLARAATQIGTGQMSAIMVPLSMYSRYFSMTNTMLNPEFVESNFMRDFQTANVNLLSKKEGTKIMKEVLKTLPKAIGGVWRGSGAKYDTTFSKHYKEFMASGGKVDFWQLKTPEASYKDVNKRIRIETTGAKGMIEGFVTPSTKYNPVLKAIERINLAIENGVRLAAFAAARKHGYSKEEAAMLSRDLTVDFNEHGDWGPNINAAYAFSGAAIQGTAVVFRALKSKKVMAAMAGFAILSYLLDQANAYLSEEDKDGQLAYDKMFDYKNQTNFVVMLGTEKGSANSAITIPMPYGFNVFPYIGNRLSKVQRGVITKSQAMTDMFSALTNAFSPINGGTLVSAITPTALKPISEVDRNKDWLGRPIYPDYPNMTGPDSQRYFRSVTNASRITAEKMNQWTGGTYAESGYVDVSPETIDHIAGTLMGGTGRFFGRSSDTISKMFQGEAPKLSTAPFTRRLYEDISVSNDRSLYFDRRTAIREAYGAAKAYAASGDPIPDHIKWKARLYKIQLQAERYRRGTKTVKKDEKRAYFLLNKAYISAWKANTPYSSSSIFGKR